MVKYDLVLPNGTFTSVTKYSNAELFFGLKVCSSADYAQDARPNVDKFLQGGFNNFVLALCHYDIMSI